MTFFELVDSVRERVTSANLAGIPFIAIQVNIIGKESGIFYIEIKDGEGHVEAYDYNDRHCMLILEQATFLKLMDGKIDPVFAYTTGKLKVEGDLAKALEFSKLIKKQ